MKAEVSIPRDTYFFLAAFFLGAAFFAAFLAIEVPPSGANVVDRLAAGLNRDIRSEMNHPYQDSFGFRRVNHDKAAVNSRAKVCSTSSDRTASDRRKSS